MDKNAAWSVRSCADRLSGAALSFSQHAGESRTALHAGMLSCGPGVGRRRTSEEQFVLKILSGLPYAVHTAQVAPVILIGAESQNFFSLTSQPQIDGNNRKYAIFFDHGKKARRNNVDARESQRLHLRGRPHQFRILIAPGPATAKLKLLVKQQVSRAC